MLDHRAAHLRQHVDKAVVALQRPLVQVRHCDARASRRGNCERVGCGRSIWLDDCLATCTEQYAHHHIGAAA